MSVPIFTQLRAALNKWRLAFVGFALAYTLILLLLVDYHPIQWDEVIHLNSGNFLYWGLYDKFILNAFYPPLFDVLEFISFETLGVSLFAARLVPVLFSVLALWLVYELANSMYGGKVGLLSAVFLAVMPGYFWVSQSAMLESSLVFFVVASLLFFYQWLTTRKDRMLVFTGIALGLGFLCKYQIIVAALILILSILFLARKQLKLAFKKFTITIAAAVLVVSPWLIITYQVYASHFLSQWLYALQVGNPERSIYSERFFQPIFYLIDVVWPYDTIHPISLLMYIAGLAGLAFFAWRRKPQDKYILIWFIVIYVFFTLISNRAWRYVLPLFPTLAISAAVLFATLFGKAESVWHSAHLSMNRKRLAKAAAGALTVLLACTVAVSIYDAYVIENQNHIDIEIEAATHYAFTNLNGNKSIMVLCPFDLLSREMVRFYLWEDGDNTIPVFQYPRQAVDAYTPDFNIAELIRLCNTLKVQYVFTYEYGGTVPYFNSTLNAQQVFEQLYSSGNFTHISSEATFGENPRRIFVLEFIG
ncbi:phospholipid carrier-dependent glycosyltransferase [Candidatus Bathyarchaeota archaeon]|nr:phospholipid carrier-dependent glycosyltransferase [Candidatus Bathyarchaeota archaeon]